MQQRIETIADDNQNTHGSCASACSSGRLTLLTRRNAPFIFGPPCQSELKRTLRHRGQPANSVHSPGINALHSVHSTRMVNDRFPAERSMVSKWWTRRLRPLFRVHQHQSKIYAESNHSKFQRIFGQFTSMQTLAIYRRLLIRSKLRAQNRKSKETTGIARCFSCFA